MSGSAATGDFGERYATTLLSYLVASDGEELLAEAYSLGREAVGTGVGVLDLASIHEKALTPLLAAGVASQSSARMVGRASAFLAECLAPFEMVHRGFREANEHLERERATLAGLAGLSDGVVLVDALRGIHYCNVRAGELLGVPAANLLGERPRVLAALLGMTPLELDAWLIERDDAAPLTIGRTGPTACDVVIQSFPSGTGGGAESFGLVLHDVTAERELARAKDEFISIVSHELRSPLTSIVGFARLLLDHQGIDEAARSYLEFIDQEAGRLTELVTDFLDIERIETGTIALDCRPTDLAELVTRVAAGFASDPTHQLVVDLPPDLPAAWADERRLQQVLVNIIANAFKYAPDGGEVRVSGRVVDGAVEIGVADQGLGLPPDAVPRLFEKLYRVESPERRRIQGTGLGLAICRQLVEAHGGRIWATSDGPRRGSTFLFTVPVAAEGRAVSAVGATPLPAAPRARTAR
jgi:signal transduction histidine kinase